MSNYPNPIEVFRNTMNQLNVQGVQRAHWVGIFSNEWNKLVAVRGIPETIVVNEDGVEMPIERRDDGKYQFSVVTYDGQRPRLNAKTEIGTRDDMMRCKCGSHASLLSQGIDCDACLLGLGRSEGQSDDDLVRQWNFLVS